jgi:hypothetical protein
MSASGRVQLEALTRHRAGSLKEPGRRGSPRLAPACMIMVSAYTISEEMRMVEEIIGRLPELSWSQLGRELRRERQRRASAAASLVTAKARLKSPATPNFLAPCEVAVLSLDFGALEETIR